MSEFFIGLGIIFIIGLVGFAIGSEYSVYKQKIDDAVSECEKSLPRDQICTWKIIATPVEVTK